MIEETARVVSSEAGHVWVEAERKSSCGHCSARAGCGTSVLDQVLGRKPMRFRLSDGGLGLQAGDRVVIGIEDSVLMRGSLMVYLMPLVFMLGGALAGEAAAPQWGGGEGVVVLAGLVGLLAGLGWVARVSRRMGTDQRYRPVLLRREGAALASRPIRFAAPGRGPGS